MFNYALFPGRGLELFERILYFTFIVSEVTDKRTPFPPKKKGICLFHMGKYTHMIINSQLGVSQNRICLTHHCVYVAQGHFMMWAAYELRLMHGK